MSRCCVSRIEHAAHRLAEQHKEVLKYLLSFMSKAPGTCIAGRLAGTAEAQPILRVYPDKSGSWSIDVENASLFLHNEDSLKAVFEDVAPGEWRLEAQVAKRWPPALAMRDLPQMLKCVSIKRSLGVKADVLFGSFIATRK